MEYIKFISITFELVVLIYCLRYSYGYYTAHRDHKKALAKMVRVADAETMQKWDSISKSSERPG